MKPAKLFVLFSSSLMLLGCSSSGGGGEGEGEGEGEGGENNSGSEFDENQQFSLLGSEISLTIIGQATPDSEIFDLAFDTPAVVSDPIIEFPSVGSLTDQSTGAPPGFGGGLVDVAIDVGADYLEIDFSNAPPDRLFASGFQNTYVITFDRAIAVSITDVSVDSAVTTLGLESSDVTFADNQLFVNVESLGFNENTFVRIDMTLEGLDALSIEDQDPPIFDRAIQFGNVEIFSFSDHRVVISNTGASAIDLASLAGTDELIAPFSLIGDACSNVTLVERAQCSVVVRFQPTATGSFNQTFDISSDASNPVSFQLSGTGIGFPTPNIEVTDTVSPFSDLNIPFGDVSLLAESQEQVVVRNRGTADLIIGSIASANELAQPFSITDDACSNTTLPLGQTCSFSVGFTPVSSGAHNDTFDIPTDDSDSEFVIISVTGQGL